MYFLSSVDCGKFYQPDLNKLFYNYFSFYYILFLSEMIATLHIAKYNKSQRK